MKECKIIQFPKINDPRGNLSFIEYEQHIPFEIERVFWTYDVPSGEQRGGHAFKNQHEIIIALSGSFDVQITNVDGSQKSFGLNRSYYGLYVPAFVWRHIENFSTNAVSLHLSSMSYDENDYIREFEEYKHLVNEL